MSSDSEHEFDEGEDTAALKGSIAGKWSDSDDDSKDDDHEVSLQTIKQKTIFLRSLPRVSNFPPKTPQ